MTTLVHLLLAVVEFFIINWLGSLSVSSGYHRITFVQTVEDAPLFNVAFRVLSPTVFLVLTAAAWYAVGADDFVASYWHVTLFYIGIRWLFNIVVGRAGLLRWPNQLVSGILAVGVSYFVANTLLVDRAAVLPSARGLTDELWIVVIGFLYVTATRVSWPALGPSIDQKRQSYLHRRFLALRASYGSVISETAANPIAEAASYAVMIYESFNRPRLYQWIESQLLFPVGLAATLGPMQVETPVRLPPRALVRAGVRRINAALEAALEEMKPEWSHELTALVRRDPVTGVEAPAGQSDTPQVTVADVPASLETMLVARAVAKYNIRSDYPGEVTGIYTFLREHDLRSPYDGPPASAG